MHKNNQILANTQLINCGKGGGSNADIFEISVRNILNFSPSFVFVAWTSYPRYSVLLNAETYDATQNIIPNSPCRDHNLNNIRYSASYLNRIRDRLTTLDHPHNGISHIVRYTNSLLKLCDLKKCKIFFINSLCDWDYNYFNKISDCELPSTHTPHTQKILNYQTRDDSEIYKLYDLIHTDYESYGGIQEAHWLNLYSSLKSNQFDVNADGMHPGYESNQLYSEFLSQALTDTTS
jgi:hypothetical protein